MLLRNLLIVDSSPTHSQTSIAVVCTVHSIYCRLQRGLDIPGWSAKQDDHGVTSPATVRPALQSPKLDTYRGDIPLVKLVRETTHVAVEYKEDPLGANYVIVRRRQLCSKRWGDEEGEQLTLLLQYLLQPPLLPRVR
jgi:hypothetical protein